MNIVCACPACHTGMYQASIENASSLTCPACGQSIAIPQGAIQVAEQNAHPRLVRCLVCPSTELFVRKNFPQRLGIAIVIAGLVASCVAWGYRDLFWTFGILFSTALLDVILFFVVPDCLTCYRCGHDILAPMEWVNLGISILRLMRSIGSKLREVGNPLFRPEQVGEYVRIRNALWFNLD